MGRAEKKVVVRHGWVVGQEAWQANAEAQHELVDHSGRKDFSCFLARIW